MSSVSFGGARQGAPKPPEKGVFPLDHFGECTTVRAGGWRGLCQLPSSAAAQTRARVLEQPTGSGRERQLAGAGRRQAPRTPCSPPRCPLNAATGRSRTSISSAWQSTRGTRTRVARSRSATSSAEWSGACRGAAAPQGAQQGTGAAAAALCTKRQSCAVLGASRRPAPGAGLL